MTVNSTKRNAIFGVLSYLPVAAHPASGVLVTMRTIGRKPWRVQAVASVELHQ